MPERASRVQIPPLPREDDQFNREETELRLDEVLRQTEVVFFMEIWSSLAYGTCFESKRRETYRGFESLYLRVTYEKSRFDSGTVHPWAVWAGNPARRRFGALVESGLWHLF